MEFSQTLYNQLQHIRQQLETVAHVSKPCRQQAIRELLDWCRQQELPTSSWVTASQAVFDHRVLALIDETLRHLGQPAISEACSGQSRLDQAGRGSRENKHISRPAQGRVRVVQPATDALLLPVLQGAVPELVLDVPLQQLNITTFTALLVVENLDSFYQCRQLHREGRQLLPPECSNALLVYRGHGHDASAVKTLTGLLRQQGKPVIYLGDFDAAGLCIALQNGFSHLLLPGLGFLHEQALTAHNEADQHEQFVWLQHRSQQLAANAPLRPWLDIVLHEQRALKQQWFAGPLHCLPLPVAG